MISFIANLILCLLIVIGLIWALGWMLVPAFLIGCLLILAEGGKK